MATKLSTGLSTMTILSIVAISLMCNTNQVSAQCGASIGDLITQCEKFVQKTGPTIPPSSGCCAVMRNLNVPCACNLITKDTEKLVSIQKAIFVARSCGLKLPPGMQCGSVTVPPKAMK